MPTYVPQHAPMPNLENLRKQAKLVLRWHRDRYYPVAAQLRAALPRYAGLSDAEILAQEFRLSDAQELVARQHGFSSWQALKAGVSNMPEPVPQSAPRTVLSQAEPQIFVTDMNASARFFTEKLGFSITFLYGEPPFYGQVKRDAVCLNLRHVDAPVIDPALRDREDLLSAVVTVESAAAIKTLFLEFQSAGVIFHQTLRKEPWGAKNFIVKDPDGNLLLFAGPAE